jgi:uncharacterized protein (DUF934 family)
MKLIAEKDHGTWTKGQNVVQLPNDADPQTLAGQLDGVDAVELQFPKFTDGRAFSQAFMLRKRLGFTGVVRATGQVLVDQLVQMKRTGFSEAVLRDGQSMAVAEKLLAHYPAFYQGDAVETAPHFVKETA